MGEARQITSPERSRVAAALLFFALLLAAVLVRLPRLQDRPFHTDEAVNAFILEELFQGGYQYRAHDHHGPSLYYFAAIVLRPFGVDRAADLDPWMLRALTVGCGVGLVALVFIIQRPFGASVALGSAAATALAAPFVYYNGIFIHESLLLLLLLGFFAAFWRLHETGRLPWAVGSGLLAGLLLATKETAAVILPIVGLAVIAARVTSPAVRTAAPDGVSAGQRALIHGALPHLRNYALVLLAALAVVIVFYSDFGRKPAHAFDLFRAIAPQVGRGLGDEHAYSWWTYGAWALKPTSLGIPWSGWFLLIFGIAGGAANWSLPRTRALAGWALGLMVVFAALRYKTPWLMLAWLLPLALLSGGAVAALWRWHKATASALLAAAITLVGADVNVRCRTHDVDPANSLAYSPSSPDLARLAADLDALAGNHRGGAEGLTIHVVARDYWPLPWTLRRFPNTGFWSEPPTVSHDGVLFSGPEYLDQFAVDGELRPYELRPGTFIFYRAPRDLPRGTP